MIKLLKKWKEKGPEISKGARKTLSKELSYAAEDVGSLGRNFVKWFFRAIEAVAVSAVLASVVYLIVLDGGIEAILARTMVAGCQSIPGMVCEFQPAYAVLAMSLVLLTSLVIYAMRLLTLTSIDIIQEKELCQSYNDDMISLLTDIQRLREVENLKGLADWKGMAYTTARRYVETFERDGYVEVERNGKGSPINVYATQ